jgi:tetratricopeptide (TPR) repeat protein
MTSPSSLPSPTTDERRVLNRRIAWGVALAALVVHLGIGMGGVWTFAPLNYDDPQVLALAGEKSIAALLTETTWYAYKPVYFLSVKIDTLFGGATSGVAHVHNALLHALAAALLFFVLCGMVRNRWIAGAAALLFAVHPVHAESVAWISSRKDVLSLVFVLAAHLLYRRARDAGRMSLAAPALLLLGGLTKGTVWVWSGVLLLDELAEGLRRRGRGEPAAWGAALGRLLPCLLLSVAGIAFDWWMGAARGPGAVEHGVSTASLAAAMAGVHARYVLHLFVPAGLSIDYGVDPAGSWSDPLAWVGLLLLLAAGGLFVVAWRRRWPLGVVAAGLWLLGLLPVNNVLPRTAILMADRYLYLPAAGLGLLVAWLLARSRATRDTVLTLVVLVLGVLGILRTGAFVDSRTVWADATEKAPHSALAWFQRANDAAVRGAWDSAVTWSEEAIALAPRPEILVKARLLKTGALLARIHRDAEAGRRVDDADLQALLDEANGTAALAADLESLPVVREDPREVQAEAEVLRGQALEQWRDPASALEAYERAVALWPAHATARYDLATLLASTGTSEDLALAEVHLKQAIRHRPGFLDARIQLAPEHPKATRLLSDIHLAQGRVLLDRGRSERDRGALRGALERFEAALRVRPRAWEAEVGAGDALLQLGRYGDARMRYRKALDVAPQQAWIERLMACCAVLEAARLARYAEDDLDRETSARLVARALDLHVTSLDLGFLPLAEELGWMRALAPRLDVGGEAAAHADRVLRAVALAVTGDDGGALAALGGVLRALAADTEEAATLDAALLLRAHLRDRAADVEGARRDYRYLAERRPADPLPRLWLLRLDLREARARLSIARGFRDQPRGIAQALARLDEAAEAITAFADEHPQLLSAGLLATEADMHRGRWIPALRRLNDLKRDFPREPSVHRGQSAIYVAQYLGSGREPRLLGESARALRLALTLDPRSPRTLLDASQVARVAGDLRRALDHARRAQAVELVGDGPAARALADLHVAIGREAVQRGDARAALEAAEAARRAAPGSASPWVLLGDAYLGARKIDDAFEAYTRAKELEPLSAEAGAGLARGHRQRVLVFRMKSATLRPPSPPGEVDPATWAEMSDEERRTRYPAWQEQTDRIRALRRQWLQQERREIRAALQLDPEYEDNDELEARLERLREHDPEVLRAAYQEAEAHYQEGREAYRAGKLVRALAAFREATRTFDDHLPAQVYTALTLHQLLLVPGDGSQEAADLEARHWHEAFEAVRAADVLDPDERFPDRHRVRAFLNDLRWRRERREDARVAALRAYERYVRAMEAAGREAEEAVKTARRRMEKLEEEE